MTYKIHIIGVGANGIPSLTADMQHLLQSVPVVCGSDRILQQYTPTAGQQTHAWISPFADNFPIIQRLLDTHKSLGVLATGDGNWYGPSQAFIRYFGTDTVTLHPNVGAFQLATSALKWHMQDCTYTTVHGRNISTLIPYLYNRAKILVLAHNKYSIQQVANMLIQMQLGESILYTLCDLGTDSQTVYTHTAHHIVQTQFIAPSDLNTIAIACVGSTPSLMAGLADNCYTHDGQITKAPIRAITMSALQPYPHGVLWDFGAGAGSISVEWCRFGGIAHAFEHTQDKCGTIAHNAEKFGVINKLHIHHTHIHGLPKNINALPTPDAIFIGGGLCTIDITSCICMLPVGGRLVANTVTLNGEQILFDTYKKYGGHIQKISINRTQKTQRFLRWSPLIPVTQYTYIKGKNT